MTLCSIMVQRFKSAPVYFFGGKLSCHTPRTHTRTHPHTHTHTHRYTQHNNANFESQSKPHSAGAITHHGSYDSIVVKGMLSCHIHQIFWQPCCHFLNDWWYDS